MAITTRVKDLMNRVLESANLRVETLTRERIEGQRLGRLEKKGHFDVPVFPLPPGFKDLTGVDVLSGVSRFRKRFDDFLDSSRNDVGYSFGNGWFDSPDAEVLYSLVRTFAPERVVEVGSGNSTKLTRQAIIDGRLNTRLVSIDPEPRTEIRQLADEFYPQPVETLPEPTPFEKLQSGDILFIDSSHEVKTGNDVIHLLLQRLPTLPKGLIIHLHDIFLPYDYPSDWVIRERWGWNEQYLVQALLQCDSLFEVLWAGHYLQRTTPGFESHFVAENRSAKSLWLRKRR